MEGLDYWRLCDELSVIQAALLIVGVDPASTQEYVCGWAPSNRPEGFDASMAALTHAILAKRLKATIRRSAWERGYNEDPGEDESIGKDERGLHIIYQANPDWKLTTVPVDDLRTWLRERGFKAGFFFPDEADSPEYLNPADSHYAPKLAAAIRAWEDVKEDPSAMRGKTAKQAIMVWLRRHANQYGLYQRRWKP